MEGAGGLDVGDRDPSPAGVGGHSTSLRKDIHTFGSRDLLRPAWPTTRKSMTVEIPLRYFGVQVFIAERPPERPRFNTMARDQ
jgi:hypothetical protein